MPDVLPAAHIPGLGWERGVTVGVNINTSAWPVYDITDYGGVGDGIANDGAAFIAMRNAANTAHPNGAILYIPAGDWPGVQPGAAYSNQVVRGAGLFATNFFGGTYIGIDPALGNAAYNPHGTFTPVKGSKTFTVTKADNGVNFSVGRLAYITFPNDPTIPTVAWTGVSDANRFRKFTSLITAITGPALTPTITLDLPLLDNYQGLPTAFIEQSQLGDARHNMGFEDFSIDAQDNFSGLQMGHAVWNCWAKNIKVSNHHNYAIYVENSSRITLKGCFCAPAGAGSNHAGFLVNNAYGVLMEHNIVYKNQPAIEINFGTAGMACVNNLFVGSFCDTNHGPHPQFNLYENNVYAASLSDGYFGSNSHDTYNRNWVYAVFDESWDTTTGRPATGSLYFSLAFKRGSRKMVLVNNVIGCQGWHTVPMGDVIFSFGGPYMGNGSHFGGTAKPSTGDWWFDWDVATGAPKILTGIITARSDPGEDGFFENGEITFNSAADITWLNARIAHYAEPPSWEGRSMFGSNLGFIELTPLGGLVVGFTGASYSAPAIGTAVSITGGPIGFAEEDLDVEASTLIKGNRDWAGNIVNVGNFAAGETAQESYMADGSNSPAYMAGFAMINPLASIQNIGLALPAGANFIRYLETGSFDPDDPTGSGGSAVVTPQFSPAPGTYTMPINVAMSCATPGAAIHYTTDGSTPTAGSPLYSAPLTLTNATTLKAIGIKVGLSNSTVRTGAYAKIAEETGGGGGLRPVMRSARAPLWALPAEEEAAAADTPLEGRADAVAVFDMQTITPGMGTLTNLAPSSEYDLTLSCASMGPFDPSYLPQITSEGVTFPATGGMQNQSQLDAIGTVSVSALTVYIAFVREGATLAGTFGQTTLIDSNLVVLRTLDPEEHPRVYSEAINAFGLGRWNDALPHLAVIVIEAARMRMYVDGCGIVEKAGATTFPAILSKLNLSSTTLAQGFAGKVFHFSVFNTAHDTATRAQVFAQIKTQLASRGVTVAKAATTVVIEGDSISQQSYIVGQTSQYHHMSLIEMDPIPPAIDFAISGNVVADAVARAATVDALYDPSRPNNILSAFIGSNNLPGGTAADAFAEAKAYCLARKAVGWKIVYGTVVVRDLIPGFEAKRVAFNSMVRADPSFYDALADFGADLYLGDPAQAPLTDYFADGVHPNAAGHARMKPLWKTAVESLIA